jgi:hypothetical protein
MSGGPEPQRRATRRRVSGGSQTRVSTTTERTAPRERVLTARRRHCEGVSRPDAAERPRQKSNRIGSVLLASPDSRSFAPGISEDAPGCRSYDMFGEVTNVLSETAVLESPGSTPGCLCAGTQTARTRTLPLGDTGSDLRSPVAGENSSSDTVGRAHRPGRGLAGHAGVVAHLDEATRVTVDTTDSATSHREI